MSLGYKTARKGGAQIPGVGVGLKVNRAWFGRWEAGRLEFRLADIVGLEW